MGKYVQSTLIAGERVVYETRPHWIIFVTLRSLFTLFIAPLIDRMSSEFVVTNRRVIIKIGLITRHILEMNLSKIESVNVDQTLMGRMLGYGSITLVGSGGTKEVFQNIENPLEFRRQFQSQQP
jgi:uncharacterized membrane protein YdbT with pleckstrin-like domain